MYLKVLLPAEHIPIGSWVSHPTPSQNAKLSHILAPGFVADGKIGPDVPTGILLIASPTHQEVVSDDTELVWIVSSKDLQIWLEDR